MNEPCGYCSGLGFHSDADPYPCPHCDSAELRHYAETIIDAAYRLYIWGEVNIDGTYDYPYDAIIEAAERVAAAQRRDWQAVEILTDKGVPFIRWSVNTPQADDDDWDTLPSQQGPWNREDRP